MVGQCVCALSLGSGCACFKFFGTFCIIVHFTIIDHIKIIVMHLFKAFNQCFSSTFNCMYLIPRVDKNEHGGNILD